MTHLNGGKAAHSSPYLDKPGQAAVAAAVAELEMTSSKSYQRNRNLDGSDELEGLL